jgi:hypothetical protein
MSGQTLGTWAGIIVAGAIGAWGIWQAGKANDHAAASAKASADAVDLARNADNRADRLERAQFERSDVDWALSWISDVDTVSVRNVGTDTAHDVELVVDIGEAKVRRETKLSPIAPQQPIGARLIEFANQAREDFKKMPSTYIGLPSLQMTVRLTWKSEAGVPGIRTWEESFHV